MTRPTPIAGTSKRRSTACWLVIFIFQTVILSLVRNSITNWPGLTACTAMRAKLLKKKVPVILAGDYNVAPTEIDIYPTSSWDDDALVQPESRAAYAKLVKQGWTDALREQHPGQRIYTFWHYWRNSWQRNAGLRIDHLLLSPELAKKLKSAGVDRVVRSKEGASDHAPAWVELQLRAQGARRWT